MRASYEQIKAELMEIYLQGCAAYGFKGWSAEQVCAWAYDEFDNAYDLPVEKLMLEVSALALTGGWYSKLVAYHKEQIEKIISTHSLGAIISILNDEESDVLVTDMKVLGLLR